MISTQETPKEALPSSPKTSSEKTDRLREIQNNTTKITEDGGILKMTIRPPTSEVPSSRWTRGANARFHYTTSAYLTPEDAEKFDTKEQCDHHDHGHSQDGHDCKSHDTHGTHTDISTKKSLASDRPIRKKVADSKEADLSKPFELRIGFNFSVKAFELCVKSMGIGEKARFLCLPEYCDGYVQLEKVLLQERENAAQIQKGLSPIHTHMHSGCAHAAHQELQNSTSTSHLAALYGVPLEFEFELIEVQAPNAFVREPWEMTVAEKWAEAPGRKEEGGKAYKEGKFQEALDKYTRALTLLESVSMSTEVQDAKRFQSKEGGTGSSSNSSSSTQIHLPTLDTLLLTCRLNYAACKLKLGDYPPVITQCSEVLNHDPDNIKGLFRRAQAYVRIGRDLELAQKDYIRLRSILERRKDLYPANGPEWTELKREEKVLEEKMRLYREKEKKMFGKMFG
ncbi:hypothetical protein HDV00_011150 [Rhizophlyctis rosea]|nr:hypothetical protein HDV00_011150 [Rhizophlyctis rosea]